MGFWTRKTTPPADSVAPDDVLKRNIEIITQERYEQIIGNARTDYGFGDDAKRIVDAMILMADKHGLFTFNDCEVGPCSLCLDGLLRTLSTEYPDLLTRDPGEQERLIERVARVDKDAVDMVGYEGRLPPQ